MHKKIAAVAFTLVIALSSISIFASEENGHDMPGSKMNEQIVDEVTQTETTSLKASNTSFGQVELSWPQDSSSTGYIVYRYDTLLQRYEPIKTIVDAKTTTFIDKNVEDNSSYRYQVTPVLAKVQHKNSNIATIKTQSVTPEIKISVDGTIANITWSAVKDAEGYEVYKSTTKDGEYEKVSSGQETGLTDSSLQKGTSYFYKVRAFQGDNFTPFSPVAGTDSIGKDDLIWPLSSSHTVTSKFGPRNSPTGGASSDHKGIDIVTPIGSNVLAAQNGTVVESSYNGLSGNYLAIRHDNGMVTRYLHLSSAKVSVGDRVEVGQVVALSGNTGVSTGPHLHFEVHVDGVAVNPLEYL